jgi:hypothetical protein
MLPRRITVAIALVNELESGYNTLTEATKQHLP